MGKAVLIGKMIDGAVKVASNKKVQKFLFGVYTDDTPRSLADCLDGEVLSPKDRAKHIYKKKKKHKKCKF